MWQAQRNADDTSSEVVRSDACTAEHMRQFVTAMNKQDLAELTKLRETIVKLENYEGSANCQYMLVRESIARGRLEQAETEFKALKQLAPEEHQLSSQLDDALVGYGSLEDSINTLRVNQQDDEDESQFWGNE